MDDAVLKAYGELEEKVKEYNPNLNTERLKTAFEFASKAHGNQLRKDGSPFIMHPIKAAIITAEMGLDEDAVIASLLHDCIEDTSATYEDIIRLFGASVADIVEGVTKLTRVVYTSKEEEQVENLRKMLMAMAKDIRVILIKIADRLHNMRTMEYQAENKQREKALETMEIYAPIAHRLGMQRVKWELEDLSLLYLDPVGYQEITDQLDQRMATLEKFMSSIKDRIIERLRETGISGDVSGRLKHIYSIYRKMYSQNKELGEVFDLCAFRVIVDTISDCYNVLGQIHDLFKPIPGKFKDYIGTPKPNMYQSIHTTVIGTEGIPFEVQIRTREMHRTAEYGVAAHWKYKQGIHGSANEEKFAWIRSLLETQQDTDAQEFVHSLKIDMFADEVFVFTPRGDVINLPAGATPIDFAYSIHSEVGNHMTGAKVNSRIVPFDHVLQNGDIVEVATSASSKGPARDWINIAKSSEARGKIKQWFKKEKRDENIIHGKASFEAELKRNNISMTAITEGDILQQILKRLSVTSLEDMYAAIGYGGMTALRAVNRFREELIRAHKQDKAEKQTEKLTQQPPPAPKSHTVNGILVDELENCLIKFSRCCTPVPGDKIVGFITKGYGVSVHRTQCQNYLNSKARGEDMHRWIDVAWGETGSEYYHTSLSVNANERKNLVMEIATVLSSVKVKITSLSIRELPGGKAVAFLSLDVKDLTELNTAINRLSMIAGVADVRRPGV
jgi:GTP pyrophosphokinase